MADLSISFNPNDIATSSDAASSALAAASDAGSKATAAQSKASDASSTAVVVASAASDAASAASDAASKATVALSKASDASSAAVLASSKASDASSAVVGVVAGTTPLTLMAVTGAARNLKTWWIFDDMAEYDTDRNTVHFNKTSSGTGSSFARVSLSGSTNLRPGLSALYTGTTTTGYCSILLDPSNLGTFQFGNGVYTFETDVYLPDLSDGTDTYTFQIGFGDKNNTDFYDGAYFQYTDVGGGSPTPNWYMCCSNGGTDTKTDTGTAVAADTWTRLKVVVNSDATSVEFFIDGVSEGTVTTNIPTGYTDAGAIIIKSAGTNTRTAYIDWIWVHYDLTTTR